MPRKKKVSIETQKQKRTVKEIEAEIIKQVKLFASHKVTSAFEIMELGKELLALSLDKDEF